MFQFTGLSSHSSMCSTSGHPVSNRIGSPIRKSSGQRLLATSPKLIAGCYVLHRLLKSRHSPCTLTRFSHIFAYKQNMWPRIKSGVNSESNSEFNFHSQINYYLICYIQLVKFLLNLFLTKKAAG